MGRRHTPEIPALWDEKSGVSNSRPAGPHSRSKANLGCLSPDKAKLSAVYMRNKVRANSGTSARGMKEQARQDKSRKATSSVGNLKRGGQEGHGDDQEEEIRLWISLALPWNTE